MANRVILGDFNGQMVLRVSRPGFNVLDPGLTVDQLAFDSRWAQSVSIHSSGQFTYDQGIGIDVWFGEWLARPPIVIMSWFSEGLYYKSQQEFYVYNDRFRIEPLAYVPGNGTYLATYHYMVLRRQW